MTTPTPTATVAWKVLDADLDLEGWSVATTWTAEGLDRSDGVGWFMGKNEKVARRLAAAINAGVVFYDISLATDVNGRTYVAASSKVLGRMANADLRRLGF